MIHAQCSASIKWIEHAESDRVILIHNGKHQHRVPHLNKADHFAMKGLKDAVVNNASVTAAKLVVGTPLFLQR